MLALPRFGKRGEMDRGKCEYPLELDMSEFIRPRGPEGLDADSDSEEAVCLPPYQLIGVIFHSGAEIPKEGHYGAYVRKQVSPKEEKEADDGPDEDAESSDCIHSSPG